MTLAKLLVRLYPRDWRAHYGAEFEAVIETQHPTFIDILDVALNALDAHINPALEGTTLPTERLVRLMQKLRTAEIQIFAAWIAFVIVGLAFNGMMDDSPYLPLMGKMTGRIALDLDFNQPLGLAWTALAGGAVVALLAVLAGGLPVAYAAWRRSPQVRRLFLIPVVAFIAICIPPAIAVGLAVTGVVHAHNPVGPATGITLLWWYGLLFVVAAIASTWAVARAIRRSDIGERPLRFAVVPGIVTTLAMALMLGASIAWGVAAHAQLPGSFDSLNLFAGYPTFASWGAVVLVMLIATIVAAIGCIRSVLERGTDENATAAVAA
jgi:hypothetical protein